MLRPTYLPCRRLWPLLACCLYALAGPAWAQENKPARPEVPPDVVYCPDLTYRTIDKAELMLDLAHPKRGDGPFPTVVILHGTGPRSKGRKYNVPLVLDLASRGYVAVAISYRSATLHPFPAAVHDAKAAVRWLRDNADRYRIDRDRFAALGFSGGGSLACFLGMTAANDGLDGDGAHLDLSARVQVVVSYFAPTDLVRLHQSTGETFRKADGSRSLVALYVQTALENWLGGPPTKVPDRYARASPITYAAKNVAPLLLIHGTEDAVVPLEQSHLLARKLREVGGTVQLLEIERAPHDFDELDDANSRRAAAAARAFLARHLQRKDGK